MDKASSPLDDRSTASILNLVKQVQYKAYVRLEAAFQPLDMTAVQFRILTTIASRPGLCSADLARIYGVKPQSMIRQIGQLEAKELIARQTSYGNKRLLELRLTEQGQSCLTQCQTAAQALERELLDSLDPAEQGQLRAILGKWHQAMNPAAGDGEAAHEVEELSEEYRRAGVQRV